jgi:hypothetical protein
MPPWELLRRPGIGGSGRRRGRGVAATIRSDGKKIIEYKDGIKCPRVSRRLSISTANQLLSIVDFGNSFGEK